MAGLTLAMFWAVAWLSKRLAPAQQTVLAVGIVLAMAIYARTVWQSTELARWLPVSSLIVVSNWFPLFLMALAAVVVRMPSSAARHRRLLVASLAACSCYAALSPLLGQVPNCGEQWTESGDCVQTTDYTCSAASAATLLRAHGIPATEREMAELCLTRRGTSWLGIYRGLKLKTQGTRWDVEVVRCSREELPKHCDSPLLIDVGLESGQHVDQAFREEYGWRPGLNHSVLLTGFTSDAHAMIVDPMPMIGREEWDPATFKLLWRGYGMRLVERQPIRDKLVQR
jgi:hypothetical protein